MIKVGAICDNLALGGQEMGCIGLLRALDRSLFSAHLYSFRAGSLLPEAQALGIPIVIGAPELAVGEGAFPDSADSTISFAAPRNSMLRQRFRKQLVEHLRDDGIDVALIYSASYIQGPVEPWTLADGMAAAREANLAAIIERTDGVVAANDPRDNSTFDKVICESKTIRNMILAQRPVLGYRRDQLVVIPNGVDLCRFDPDHYDRAQCRDALQLEAGDFVIGAIARLAPEKNLAHLLRAIEIVVRTAAPSGRRVKVVIAGPDRGCEAELRAQAARLGIAERVAFCGPRSDVPELLRAFDVFAITSITEGTPFAVLEAMAMGLPIVATPVGSIPEVIDGNGYLVSLLHPEDAANALIALMEHPELAGRLGRRSRKLALKHDLDLMTRRYQKVLEEAFGCSRPAPLSPG
jgi:glycosyltransferase involved in cell wall biosynthesis